MLTAMFKRDHDELEDPNVRNLATFLHAQSLGNAQQCRLVSRMFSPCCGAHASMRAAAP